MTPLGMGTNVFFIAFRRPCGPTRTLSICTGALILEVKRREHRAHRFFPPSSTVKIYKFIGFCLLVKMLCFPPLRTQQILQYIDSTDMSDAVGIVDNSVVY